MFNEIKNKHDLISLYYKHPSFELYTKIAFLSITASIVWKAEIANLDMGKLIGEFLAELREFRKINLGKFGRILDQSTPEGHVKIYISRKPL